MTLEEIAAALNSTDSVTSIFDTIEGLEKQMKTPTMKAWNVLLDSVQIDTVYFQADCPPDAIRAGLIEHDGYDESIEIVAE